MAMPRPLDLTLPLLQLASRGDIGHAEAAQAIADELQLSQEERSERLENGPQTRFANRVYWAKVQLGMAGLVKNAGTGRYRATAAGLEVLRAPPAHIDRTFLMKFPAYREKAARSKRKINQATVGAATTAGVDDDPTSDIEQAAATLNEAVATDLLERIHALTPRAFELLIIRVMRAMGYGGTDDTAARHLGGPGDGGVDGVIDGDPLGLDVVYLQAKRYAPGSSVGSQELRAFVGSLVGRGAAKGVFVTTSDFSQQARVYARSVHQRVILIEGARLAELMMRFDVGVRTKQKVEIKEVDENFFLSDLS